MTKDHSDICDLFESLRLLIDTRLPSNAHQEAVLDSLSQTAKLICAQLGHRPVQDHCGMPAHDFCELCQTLMPGEAHHPQGPCDHPGQRR